jgi:acylphosphatase
MLGAVSSTDDITGEIVKTKIRKFPSRKEIKKTVKEIQKRKTQIPPKFSAIKIKGKPAYELSRKGMEFSMKEKEASLIDYRIISVNKSENGAVLEVEMEVSAGFYIRSFARDLGEVLGTGGYLEELVRTGIGEFDLKRALEPGDLDQKIELYFKASGDVQRIGFRYFASKIALELNITGFARNLVPISIEVVGQGKLGVLERFLDILKKGPDTAKIESFSAYFRKPEVDFSNFMVSE